MRTRSDSHNLLALLGGGARMEEACPWRHVFEGYVLVSDPSS